MGGWGGGLITFMPRGLHCASLEVGRWQGDVCNECGFGSDIMKRDAVAVVCVLVLLLRLDRFPEPLGFAELPPLFRMCVYALDAYVDGLCVDVRDDVQRFVVEATLQVERSWANWDLVAAARSRKAPQGERSDSCSCTEFSVALECWARPLAAAGTAGEADCGVGLAKKRAFVQHGQRFDQNNTFSEKCLKKT